jgi:hypothetical protein
VHISARSKGGDLAQPCMMALQIRIPAGGVAKLPNSLNLTLTNDSNERLHNITA